MSGSYEVDPEALPRAIAELKEAREVVAELEDRGIAISAKRSTRGDDGVSMNAGDQLARLGGDPGEGSLAATAAKLRAELDNTIFAFEEMLRGTPRSQTPLTLPPRALRPRA
ncbi:hypothetical protein [Actinoalloteichus caeruleus]|uniref:hypothetical protein n=1 Tax=Actinoalloteichus cyanogriseus TaxID=2893586 RepID=UPI0004C05243|nr:hypothetical protein [Actinoalloteichus caeruleus]